MTYSHLKKKKDKNTLVSLATENRLGQPHETIVVDHTKILSRSLKKRKSPSHTHRPVVKVQVDEYPDLNLSIAVGI